MNTRFLNIPTLLITLFAGFLALLPGTTAAAQDDSPLVIYLTAEGPVAPPLAEYLSRGIERAERDGAELLVFQLDTPGGSLDAMNDMVKEIRASSIPIVIYVAPEGAMAASAGAVIRRIIDDNGGWRGRLHLARFLAAAASEGSALLASRGVAGLRHRAASAWRGVQSAPDRRL